MEVDFARQKTEGEKILDAKCKIMKGKPKGFPFLIFRLLFIHLRLFCPAQYIVNTYVVKLGKS